MKFVCVWTVLTATRSNVIVPVVHRMIQRRQEMEDKKDMRLQSIKGELQCHQNPPTNVRMVEKKEYTSEKKCFTCSKVLIPSLAGSHPAFGSHSAAVLLHYSIFCTTSINWRVAMFERRWKEAMTMCTNNIRRKLKGKISDEREKAWKNACLNYE